LFTILILQISSRSGYDYYGPVANAAARIEHIGFGGQTLISSAVCSLLSEEVKRECDLKTVGSMELRGVSEEVFVYQCLPISLGARKFCFGDENQMERLCPRMTMK